MIGLARSSRLALIMLALCAIVLLAARPARANFPGVNGRLAFSQCDDASCHMWRLYGVNPDGSGVVPLFPLTDPNRYEDGSVSADGREIVAQACVPGGSGNNCGLSLAATNGSGTGVLTDPNSGNYDDYPSFSPDGSTVVFNRSASGGGSGTAIWAIGVNGSNPHALTTVNSSVFDGYARYSPDGHTIVFERFDNSVPEENVWLMNADGTNPHKLTNVSTDQDGTPDFSPDGATIVFTRCPSGSSCALWLMQANGDNPHAITTPGMHENDAYPAFSPDGRQIVFQRYNNSLDLYSIHVLTLATGQVTQLSTGDDYSPAWGRVPTPSIDAPPTIAGTARVGHALSAAPGATPWGGTAAFQWLRCDAAGNACVPIAGATAANYTAAPADRGKRLRVRQTQSSPGGSATADSAPTASVLKEPGLSLARSARVVRGTALVKITCPPEQNGVCAGTLTLTTRLAATTARKRTVKAGRAKYRVNAGKHRTLKVRLSKRVRAALSRTRKLKVKAVTVSKDALGNATTTRRTLTLTVRRH